MFKFFRTTIKSLLIKTFGQEQRQGCIIPLVVVIFALIQKVRQHLRMSDNINKQHHALLAVIVGPT